MVHETIAESLNVARAVAQENPSREASIVVTNLETASLFSTKLPGVTADTRQAFAQSDTEGDLETLQDRLGAAKNEVATAQAGSSDPTLGIIAEKVQTAALYAEALAAMEDDDDQTMQAKTSDDADVLTAVQPAEDDNAEDDTAEGENRTVEGDTVTDADDSQAY